MSAVAHWWSVRLGVQGLLVPDPPQALCFIIEQDTLSSH